MKICSVCGGNGSLYISDDYQQFLSNSTACPPKCKDCDGIGIVNENNSTLISN